MARTPSTLWPVLAFHMLAASGPLTSNCGVSPEVAPSPAPGRSQPHRASRSPLTVHRARGKGERRGGGHVGEMELAVAGRDDPGLEERPRAGPHLGVVARQEQVGPGPLQDGGGRRGGFRRPGQGRPYLGQVAEKGVALVGQGTDKCLVRAQIDPARAAWVDAASEASCCRAATRSGPAVCGRRSRVWDWPTVLMPVPRRPARPLPTGPAPSGAGGRPPGARRPARAAGRTSRPCALLKLDWAVAEGSDRGAGQDAVGRQALPGRLHRRLAVADVLGRDHHVDDRGHRPEHHDRDDGER